MSFIYIATISLCLHLSLAHLSARYQSVRNQKVSESSSVSLTQNFDTLGSCASYCNFISSEKTSHSDYDLDCQGFASRDTWKTHTNTDADSFRGFQCEFYFSNYTGYVTSSTGWLLWTKKTTTNTARSVSTVTPETLEPECPVVWRQWPHNNATIGSWTMSTSSGSDASPGVDGDNSTVSSDTGSYPYYLIDLSRSMRVTKLAVLGGDNVALHPLENLEVRVGNITITTGGGTLITSNIRCGVYYGPTLVSKQWIEIDCGYSKGIYGRYVSLQLLERRIASGGGNLEIAEIEVYGWGRICNKDV